MVNDIEKLQKQLEHEIEAHRKTKIKLRLREHENHAITSSRSYKLARMAAGSVHVLRISLRKLLSLNPRRIILIESNRRHVKQVYKSDIFLSAFTESATADLAVIIHLYYPEMAKLFADKLKSLEKVKYDLYCTIPDSKMDMLPDVKKYLPSARIALVPNCGRDILPFIQTMKQIDNKNYEIILKLHSKKSPHRKDGTAWRDKILASLLPDDTSKIQDILALLRRKDTAIVGPGGEYVSMLVNLSATTGHVKRTVASICGEQTSKELMRHPDEYGFFGGTMFWARIDALRPIYDDINVADFEPELGQEDSTLAHALERIFNIVPELRDMKMYEIASKNIIDRPYETTNIPRWSELSIDD